MTCPYISASLRRQVAADANTRCGYCLSDEALSGAPLSVDHIVPVAAGGPILRENLWLTCRSCNERKSTRIHAPDPDTSEQATMFNPRTQVWAEHFAWSEDGTLMIDLTPTGRATIAVLQLNRSILQRARRR